MGATKLWSEAQRLKIWYSEIRRRADTQGWSNYRLELMFWPPEDRFGEDGQEKSDGDRPRPFSNAAKGIQLSEGKGRWPDKTGLLDRMEVNPVFAGTKALYMATFWAIWYEMPVSIGAAVNRIHDFMDRYQLCRLDEIELEALLQMRPDVSRIELYRESIEECCSLIPVLEQAGFLWSLHRVTSSSANNALQHVAAELLDYWFEHFVITYLTGDDQMIFYDEVMNAIKSERLDVAGNAAALDQLENLGRDFIVPKSIFDPPDC